LLFPAQAAEKLVEVVHNSRWTIHSAPLLRITDNLAFWYSLLLPLPPHCSADAVQSQHRYTA
jgi:hypothetical protein